MTRNNSVELTARAREQFDTWRHCSQLELAETILDIIGVRFFAEGAVKEGATQQKVQDEVARLSCLLPRDHLQHVFA